MIFRRNLAARGTKLLLACLLLISLAKVSFGAEALPKEILSRLKEANLVQPVLNLLEENLTFLPTGFWVSGATVDDFIHGIALRERVSSINIEPALRIQATSGAFMDLIILPAFARELPPELQVDLQFYILGNELWYQMEKLEETIHISKEPASFLIQIGLEDVTYGQNDFDQKAFYNYLYKQALAWAGQNKQTKALFRLNWLLDQQTSREVFNGASLAKAQIKLEQGDYLGAFLTILPLLEYDEKYFFQSFSTTEISFILTVLELGGFPDLGIELAALAVVFYPEHMNFERQLLRLLKLKEGTGP